jgi:uncharacterized protein YmfQ (DUF2313 family)
MKVWLMIIHAPDDDVRNARAFTARDAAIRAIREVIHTVEAEFDPDAAGAAMARWDKVLSELPEGDTALRTDWDSNAVIDLREAELET